MAQTAKKIETSDIKKTLAKVVVKMLNPLIKLLLRYDVSHSEFSELAKRSYVDVAYKYFIVPNRKKTINRVSVITGLSRKEVVRLAKLDHDAPPVTKGPLNRAVRVISGWLRDPDFLDNDAYPKVLPLRGDGITFQELVQRYSGDVTARAILDELIRTGAAERVQDFSVKLKHHGYIPQDNSEEKLEVTSTHVADLLNTCEHNISVGEGADNRRFQRQVTYAEVPENVIREFQQLSHDKAMKLLLELNHWLAQNKDRTTTDNHEIKGRVGMGIYYLEEREPDKESVIDADPEISGGH